MMKSVAYSAIRSTTGKKLQWKVVPRLQCSARVEVGLLREDVAEDVVGLYVIRLVVGFATVGTLGKNQLNWRTNNC